IEDILVDSNFIRIHKSYIVNKNYIKGFKSDEFKLDLITGDSIPVSDTLFSKKKLMDAISS
ncbi:LytTR family DNA-binding domain-containing protein, partial [Flavobacterium psychrophilum]